MCIYRKYLNKENWNMDKINNFIKKKSTDNIYKLQLDNELPKKDNFINNEIIITFFNTKINSINNTPIVNDFIKNFNKSYKICIFLSISDKAYELFNNLSNIEAFEERFFMIDLQSHHCAPDYEILTRDEIESFKNDYNVNLTKMKQLLYSDPVVKYLNLSKGNIVRIIRKSMQSGRSVDYRLVV